MLIVNMTSKKTLCRLAEKHKGMWEFKNILNFYKFYSIYIHFVAICRYNEHKRNDNLHG